MFVITLQAFLKTFLQGKCLKLLTEIDQMLDM